MTEPVYTRAAKAVVNGPNGRQFFVVPEDTDAQRVAELVAQGVDQLTASRQVYGVPPAWDAPRGEWSTWIRWHVADLFRPLREAIERAADRIDTRYADALNQPGVDDA